MRDHEDTVQLCCNIEQQDELHVDRGARSAVTGAPYLEVSTVRRSTLGDTEGPCVSLDRRNARRLIKMLTAYLDAPKSKRVRS